MRPRLFSNIVVVLLAMAIASRAIAQLIEVPQPIAFTEFVGAIRERGGGIDVKGWNELRVAYQRYLEGCESLRTGTDASVFRGELVPCRPSGSEFQREFRDALRRLRPQRDLDQALVEAAVLQLPPEASARASILRIWCERRWLLAVSSWNDRSTGRWLPGVLRRCCVSKEDAVIVRDAVDDLEQRLVVLERKRLELAPKCLDNLLSLRFQFDPRPEGEDEDPVVQEWLHAQRAAARRAWLDLRVVDKAIDESVDRAVASMLPYLSIAGQRSVSAAQMSGRFGELEFGDPIAEIAPLREWLLRTDVPRERRAEAKARIEEWRIEDDRAVVELLKHARAWSRAKFDDELDPLGDGEDRADRFVEEIETMANRRNERAVSIAALLTNHFGITDAEPVDANEDQVSAPHVDDNDPLFAGIGGRDDGSEVDEEYETDSREEGEEPANGIRATTWIDAPPKAGDLTQLIERFNIEPSRRAVLETLHADLVTAWTERVDPLLYETENTNFYLSNGRFDLTSPARMTVAGRAMRSAALDLLQEFFDAVALVAPPSELGAVATWRLSVMLGSPQWAAKFRAQLPTRAGGSGVSLRHANLALAVRESELAHGDRDAAEEMLKTGSGALEDAHRAMDEGEIAAQRAALEAHLRLANLQKASNEDEPFDYEDALREFARENDEIAKRLEGIAAARIALDEVLMSDLAARLSTEAITRIRRVQLRLCYPGLDADRPRIARLASRALDLPTLEADRMARVAEAIERWRDAYDALTDRLAELGPQPRPLANGATLDQSEHGRQSGWLNFRREQINAELLHDLAIVLTDAERRVVTGLPKP